MGLRLTRASYRRLPTEQRLADSARLDQLSVPRLLALMNREDARAVRAVAGQRRAIARGVRLITGSLRRGGRLIFIGAGTSGRLGVLEAAECPPTFSTAPSLIQAFIAGGRGAVFRSREGAEDNRAAARRALKTLRRGDAVVGIAASGVTPFVDEALRAARARGAATILITGHPRTAIPARVRVVLRVGPEVLTGSTRLKMGTATKLVLNMLTLGAMVQLGKTYGHYMVDVRPGSAKLRARAASIVRQLTGRTDAASEALLRAARGQVKAAVVMHRTGLSYPEAKRRLAAARGRLRDAMRGHG
jgi:N-acetylmuramic acid 6-phosphate etherase